jgi:choline dehydrogenase-like flavoprotein
MPNFRNVYRQEEDFQRGYLVFWGAYRNTGNDSADIGADLKKKLSEAGDWSAYMSMQGEVIPKKTNHVRLSKDLKDDWGIPQLITSVDYDENDEKMVKDFLTQGAEILEIAGCKNIKANDNKQAPGLDIHEMGGVRMGRDPSTSMLNEWNQLHNCKNVFVTDGACMTSVGNQNPSLTFMAITARAANHAVEELKRGNL